MDNKEDKSEISRSSIEEVDEHKATKSEEINNDQVIVDPPKIVKIESDANTGAEQVKDEEENNNDQVIIDPPKIVTIESEANIDAEQVKDEEENNNDQVIIDPPKIVTIESEVNIDAEQVKDEEENNNDQVIIDPPKIVTIESEANIDAEQVKDEEENNSNPAEGNKNEQVEKDRMESSELVKIDQIEKETKCRPIAFLLGLPFALISLVIAFIGGIIWIIGLILTCICPCCFCVTVLVEMALGLVNAPFQFFHYITDKIPF